jgi:methyl-accepting chemotaxis protein
MLVIGGILLFNVNQVSDVVRELSGKLLNDQITATETQRSIMLMQIYAGKYIAEPNEVWLEGFNNAYQQVGVLLETNQAMSEGEDETGFVGIRTDLSAYNASFEGVVSAIDARNQLLGQVFNTHGKMIEASLEQVRQRASQMEDAETLFAAGNAKQDFQSMQFSVMRFLENGSADEIRKAENLFNGIQSEMETLKKTDDSFSNQMIIRIGQSLEEYWHGLEEIQTVNAELVEYRYQMQQLDSQIRQTAVAEENAVRMAFAEQSKDAISIAGNLFVLFIILFIGMLVVVVLFSVKTVRDITRPLNLVTQTSRQITNVDLVNLIEDVNALAEGNLNRVFEIPEAYIDVKTRDEVGELAQDFNQMVGQLQVVGNALTIMVENLAGAFGRIIENVHQLRQASKQLTMVSQQTGEATDQVSRTIQQVAGGISLQAESTSRTFSSLGRTNHVVHQVAEGAQEQVALVSESAALTNQIGEQILEVSQNTHQVADGLQHAGVLAEEGSKRVSEAIAGMDAIKNKVGSSAEAVALMGKRSEEISVIVNAIDEIARETNLLALNAAIEAARAGEQGRGFAVVADEVGALAQRSREATKEVSVLISGIQDAVNLAVSTMSEGTKEVDSGVHKVNAVGVALDKIVDASNSVNLQARTAELTTSKMQNVVEQLSKTMETVLDVARRNDADAEEISHLSAEVSKAMENIASVSEQNSAAVEEVSASAEEMSAQIETFVSSAEQLEAMADDLSVILSAFKLPGQEAVVEV